MTVYRFLLTRRWIGFAVFVIALSALCVRLGFWQWHRMEHKQHQEALVRTHLSAEPVPLGSLSKPGRPIAEDDEWTRVSAIGRFDVPHQVTVKFTTRDGAAGADVVTPLLLPNGMAVLVNRGWMPTANDAERPRDVPAPPSGRVAIEGWLRPDNGAERNAVVPFQGQVRAIASRGMQKFVGRTLLPGFVNLQHPRAAQLAPEPQPSISHALNFFYALQWWFFAALAFFGYFWFARAEAREIRGQENRGRSGQAREIKSA
jgi:cytochrome oxidase assembly protein ShyY1